LERERQPWGDEYKKTLTLKALGMRLGTLSGLMNISNYYPGFSLCPNPGLKLANAFGVKWNAFGVKWNAFGVK
jgi:hypothetical protein